MVDDVRVPGQGGPVEDQGETSQSLGSAQEHTSTMPADKSENPKNFSNISQGQEAVQSTSSLTQTAKQTYKQETSNADNDAAKNQAEESQAAESETATEKASDFAVQLASVEGEGSDSLDGKMGDASAASFTETEGAVGNAEQSSSSSSSSSEASASSNRAAAEVSRSAGESSVVLSNSNNGNSSESSAAHSNDASASRSEGFGPLLSSFSGSFDLAALQGFKDSFKSFSESHSSDSASSDSFHSGSFNSSTLSNVTTGLVSTQTVFSSSGYTSGTSSTITATGFVSGTTTYVSPYVYSSYTYSPYAYNYNYNNMVTVATTKPPMPILAGLTKAVSYSENAIQSSAQVIDSSVLLADINSPDFNGGNVTIVYASGGSTADKLTVANQGTGSGQIGVSGSTISYEGNNICTISTNGANGASLVITFNTANATVAAVDALIQALSYQNTSDSPATSRTLRLTIDDGDGQVSAAHDILVTINAEGDSFTLTSGTDNFSAGTGADTFTTLDADFSASDVLSSGSGTDTLIFSDAATITTAELANKTGIDVIQLDGNSTIALSDAFVDASDSNSVRINNSTYTVSLDTSALVSGHNAVIGGTGTVTLSAAGKVSAAAGVNTTIVGSAGADTLTGSTGADTLTGSYGGDTISGGAGNDVIYADNQAFTASTVSGLTLWLDAKDINGDGTALPSSGSDLTTWVDKSSSGYDMTTVASRAPRLTYDSDGIPVVRFDSSGGGDFMSNIAANANFGSTYSAFFHADVLSVTDTGISGNGIFGVSKNQTVKGKVTIVTIDLVGLGSDGQLLYRTTGEFPVDLTDGTTDYGASHGAFTLSMFADFAGNQLTPYVMVLYK